MAANESDLSRRNPVPTAAIVPSAVLTANMSECPRHSAGLAVCEARLLCENDARDEDG